MSDHKISADGLRIECHAPDTAPCHLEPTCDGEMFSDTKAQCLDHDTPHAMVHGPHCWMLPWVNCPGLEDTFARWDQFEIRPGAPVTLTWDDEYLLWDYEADADAPRGGHAG